MSSANPELKPSLCTLFSRSPRLGGEIKNFEPAPTSILVVENEALVHFAISYYFRECGFHAIEAAGGDEARELRRASDHEIGLVFSDVQMSCKIDGFGLARWICKHLPGLPVVLTSRTARTMDLRKELWAIGLIETRPYVSHKLERRIRATTAHRQAHGAYTHRMLNAQE